VISQTSYDKHQPSRKKVQEADEVEKKGRYESMA
jgi:hypothetical protein